MRVTVSSDPSSTICSRHNGLPTETGAKAGSSGKFTVQKFTYSRASPHLRWSNLKLDKASQLPSELTLVPPVSNLVWNDESTTHDDELRRSKETVLLRRRRYWMMNGKRRMGAIELKKDKNWRERVQFLTDRILALNPSEFVADILDKHVVQMNPTDYCFVVKWVGRLSWCRALEVYEWFNLKEWYYPNERMLAMLLGVLGKANQESLAAELFSRVEPAFKGWTHACNAMMSVYARNGRFERVQELLELMRERGCEPDLISFNTLINARVKAGIMSPDSSMEILDRVRAAGLRPDTVTYNTLISACSRGARRHLKKAVEIFDSMTGRNCQPDLWTFNSMISVYGRSRLPHEAEKLFIDLQIKGFVPDVVTYNALLHAFAAVGNAAKVEKLREDMARMGFAMDEVSYNTVIHMYGKKRSETVTVLRVYEEMKAIGKKPDAFTFNTLIGSLARDVKMAEETERMIAEMLENGVRPTLPTYTIMIAFYARSGKRAEAEESFRRMLRSGIAPDRTAYSVMLDTFLRFRDPEKAMSTYRKMLSDGFAPDLAHYESLLFLLADGSISTNDEGAVVEVAEELRKLRGVGTRRLFSVLVGCGLHRLASVELKESVERNLDLDRSDFLAFVNSYAASSEAIDLLRFFRRHGLIKAPLVAEAFVYLHGITGDPDLALKEYRAVDGGVSLLVFESLIRCCEEHERFAEASRVFSDLMLRPLLKPSVEIYRRMISVYCSLDLPETARYILDSAELVSVRARARIVECYARLRQWNRAESFVDGSVNPNRLRTVLMECYVRRGLYERAKSFMRRMAAGRIPPAPSVADSLLSALLPDDALAELRWFNASKDSMIMILEGFSSRGDADGVKEMYGRMKSAGYIPPIGTYRTVIGMFCRNGWARDSGDAIESMEEDGYKPDVFTMNSVLRMFVRARKFWSAARTYEKIRASGLEPNEHTYNSLIAMHAGAYSLAEALSVVDEMRKEGFDPSPNSYRTLISLCGKSSRWREAESLFVRMQELREELSLSSYHTMMKVYRDSANIGKAEELLDTMKARGVECTTGSVHLLMVTYGMCGKPEKAREMLGRFKGAGTMLHGAVIDGYIKSGDHGTAVGILREMRRDGIEPDHRIWTCFIRGASAFRRSADALRLLSAVEEAGFCLPSRLLESGASIAEAEDYLRKIEREEEGEVLNFVNALEDLLWAFDRKSTAALLFQLAIDRRIYRDSIFRVAETDWRADLRRFSIGASLVGLTLWLSRMQVAALQGSPRCSKYVVLILGESEYNGVSVNRTVRTQLWAMRSPFLPHKTRASVLVAKGTPLRMWLKESCFCQSLELKDGEVIPDMNSMQNVDSCVVRPVLAPAVEYIMTELLQTASHDRD